MKKLKRQLAEWLHPERENPHYWLAKVLERELVNLPDVDFGDLTDIQKLALARDAYQNKVVQSLFKKMYDGERDYIATQAQTKEQQFYSRAVMHVIVTMLEKLKAQDDELARKELDNATPLVDKYNIF